MDWRRRYAEFKYEAATQAAQKAGAKAQMAKIATAQANLKAAQANFKTEATQAAEVMDWRRKYAEFKYEANLATIKALLAVLAERERAITAAETQCALPSSPS